MIVFQGLLKALNLCLDDWHGMHGEIGKFGAGQPVCLRLAPESNLGEIHSWELAPKRRKQHLMNWRGGEMFEPFLFDTTSPSVFMLLTIFRHPNE